eukprot:279353_1
MTEQPNTVTNEQPNGQHIDTPSKPSMNAESRSFSLKKIASHAIQYEIPDSMESTKLKHGFQPGYIVIWFIAIIASTSAVLGDWLIVIIFKVNICEIDNNYDSSNLNVEFFSFNSFGGLIQQIWLTVICLGGFSLYYFPQVIGIDETNPKKLRNARISVFIWLILYQVVVNLFLVPIEFNFRSLFNAFSLLTFFIWAWLWTKSNGIRATYPLFVTIFMTVILYYIISTIIFSNMSTALYAITYPLYITLVQNILIKILEYLDCCKYCKNNTNNNDKINVNDTEKDAEIDLTITETSFLDRMAKWRDTAAVNDWPGYYIYFMCAMIVVMAESFRLCSYVIVAKESIPDLFLSLIISIVTETLTRNMIFNIIYDKYIMKQTVSRPISSVKSIFLGCKYHTDYIPILLIIVCNLCNFGHTTDCYYSRVQISMDISNGYEWLIAVFFVYEIVTDLTTWFTYKLLKKYDLLLHDESNKALKIAFIVLTKPQMFLMMISLGYWSFVAFIYDDSSRPQIQ